MTGTIPGDWALSDGEWCELVVDLGFNTGVPGFQSEALVFSPDGAIVSALEPLNRSVILDGVPGDSFELYLEAASNPDMAQGFTLAGCYCRTGGQLLPRRSAPGNVRVACVSGRFRPATRNRVMHSMHSKSGENRHPREARGHLGSSDNQL